MISAGWMDWALHVPRRGRGVIADPGEAAGRPAAAAATGTKLARGCPTATRCHGVTRRRTLPGSDLPFRHEETATRLPTAGSTARHLSQKGRRRGINGLSRETYQVLSIVLVAFGLGHGGSNGAGAVTIDESANGAIGTTPKPCGKSGGQVAFCSRCENTTALWLSADKDPSWIDFKEIFANRPKELSDVSPTDGRPITFVRGQPFSDNQYHYFEFKVEGGDGQVADDIRRDAVYLSLVSPEEIPVAKGQIIQVSENNAKKPAYDFYVGQNCVPQEGRWNNQGYGNVNADEKMKSIYVNVTRDARYFIALQSRKMRYGVAAFDYSMRLSRGSLVSKYKTTRCQPLQYRYPDEIARMYNEFRQTGVIAQETGGAIPFCGATPPEKK